MSVGDEQLVLDDGSVLERDHGLRAERFLPRVLGVIALGPDRIFNRLDLAPQAQRRRFVRALRIGMDVMPGAVLKRHREDVRSTVVEGFARCVRIVLLRVVCAAADYGVRVMARSEYDALD